MKNFLHFSQRVAVLVALGALLLGNSIVSAMQQAPAAEAEGPRRSEQFQRLGAQEEAD